MSEMKHNDITDKIIKAFYCVYGELGYGFLENVYENALAFELKYIGLSVEQQFNIDVYYKAHIVGKYKADLVVNDLIIVELKAVEHLTNEHGNQLINYLKATDKEVGLLLNFGKKAEICRKVYENSRKKRV